MQLTLVSALGVLGGTSLLLAPVGARNSLWIKKLTANRRGRVFIKIHTI